MVRCATAADVNAAFQAASKLKLGGRHIAFTADLTTMQRQQHEALYPYMLQIRELGYWAVLQKGLLLFRAPQDRASPKQRYSIGEELPRPLQAQPATTASRGNASAGYQRPATQQQQPRAAQAAMAAAAAAKAAGKRKLTVHTSMTAPQPCGSTDGAGPSASAARVGPDNSMGPAPGLACTQMPVTQAAAAAAAAAATASVAATAASPAAAAPAAMACAESSAGATIEQARAQTAKRRRSTSASRATDGGGSRASARLAASGAAPWVNYNNRQPVKRSGRLAAKAARATPPTVQSSSAAAESETGVPRPHAHAPAHHAASAASAPAGPAACPGPAQAPSADGAAPAPPPPTHSAAAAPGGAQPPSH